MTKDRPMTDRPTPETDALFARHTGEIEKLIPALFRGEITPAQYNEHTIRQAAELMAHARAMEAQLDQALDVLTAIMPYVEEDYHDGCATERFRRAVTEARAVLGRQGERKGSRLTSAAKNSVHPLVRPVWMDWINRRVAKNLDKWGVQDFETLGLAVCEEAGELAQAILQNKHENGERVRITQEALDLAALCVQVLVTMKEKHGAENVWNALFADESND